MMLGYVTALVQSARSHPAADTTQLTNRLLAGQLLVLVGGVGSVLRLDDPSLLMPSALPDGDEGRAAPDPVAMAAGMIGAAAQALSVVSSNPGTTSQDNAIFPLRLSDLSAVALKLADHINARLTRPEEVPASSPILESVSLALFSASITKMKTAMAATSMREGAAAAPKPDGKAPNKPPVPSKPANHRPLMKRQSSSRALVGKLASSAGGQKVEVWERGKPVPALIICSDDCTKLYVYDLKSASKKAAKAANGLPLPSSMKMLEMFQGAQFDQVRRGYMMKDGVVKPQKALFGRVPSPELCVCVDHENNTILQVEVEEEKDAEELVTALHSIGVVAHEVSNFEKAR
jgi:hypothetical protein